MGPRRANRWLLLVLAVVAIAGGAVFLMTRGATPAAGGASGVPGSGPPGTATLPAATTALTGTPPPATRTPHATAAGSTAAGSATPGTGANASGGPGPSNASASAGPSGSAAPSGGADAPAASAAPTSAVGFDPRRTVVPIGFPLPATAKYTYGAAWRTPRLGVVYPYNQIRGVTAKGTLLRAHDGVDLLVKIGTPVLAPFTGVVVNPAAIWKPWDPQRYGNVVVIQSTEPTSTGYRAILVHLSKVKVKIGQAVTRGQVVGLTGISGNAAETTPHLHFELRAPFLITFHYAGVTRRLDDFDPAPSLHAADPHH